MANPTHTTNTTSIIPVPYTELIEGLREGANDRGPYATKSYLVAWGDRWKFARAMRGTAGLSGGATGAWIRAIPFAYPDNPVMYAMDLTIEPEGGVILGVSPIAFTNAKITVTFGALDWVGNDNFNSFGGDSGVTQFATQELDTVAEFIQIPGSNVWRSDLTTPVNTPANRRVVSVRMVITYHRYPLIPMGTIQGLADCVNDAVFLGCARGTVMFESVKTIRETSTDGNTIQKVTISLKWRAQEWNKFLMPDGTWDFVYYNKDNTKPVYPYASFNVLLL
jgi:hypothetical protein